MEHYLPYAITQCYLPPNMGERTPSGFYPYTWWVQLVSSEKYRGEFP